MFFKVKEHQIDLKGKKILIALDVSSGSTSFDSNTLRNFLKESFFESPPDLSLVTVQINLLIHDVNSNLDQIPITIQSSGGGFDVQNLYNFAKLNNYDSILLITDGLIPTKWNDYSILTTILLEKYNPYFVKEYTGNVIIYEK